MCQEVHRSFFHQFIHIGSTILYPRYVEPPLTSQDAATHISEFEKVGFSGCCGSTDATHIVIEKCSHRLKQNHNGGKLTHTARTFNLTVNHRRQILSTTQGYPARWNDKTLVLFDDFVRGIFE